MILNDPRKFGFIDYELSKKINSRKYLNSLGVDALSTSFKGLYLFSKICKSIVPIKQILLNQTIIAGIGNIYASEILFNAKISPLQRGKDLKLLECNKICISSKKEKETSEKTSISLKETSIGRNHRELSKIRGCIRFWDANFRVQSPRLRHLHYSCWAGRRQHF